MAKARELKRRNPLPKWVNTSLVVSRDPETSKVISRFGDDFWNLEVYRAKNRGACKIVFSKFDIEASIRCEVEAQLRVLFYLLLTESNSGRESILAVTTVCGQYKSLLSGLVRYCGKRGTTPYQVLEEPSLVLQFAKAESVSIHGTLASLLGLLYDLGSEKTGLKVLNGPHLQKLRSARLQRQSSAQTEFIPERLLDVFLAKWVDDISSFNLRWKKIESFLTAVFDKPGAGLSEGQQTSRYGIRSGEYQATFEVLAKSKGLTEYFAGFSITDVKKLSSHIVYMQAICKCVVHLYSGMRDDEAMSLQSDSLRQLLTTDGAKYWQFYGDTTKYSGRKKTVTWVTSSDVEPAWTALMSVAAFIAKRTGAKKPWPAFISVGYLGLSGRTVSKPNGQARTHLQGIDPIRYIGDAAVIAKNDVDSLRAVEPGRDWSRSEFRVGKRWPLRSHQFRRTIALMSAKSGLVSMPSLKRQLQHVTQAMSFYYCKGSAGLSEVGDFDDKFMELFRLAGYEATAYSYVADFLLSTETVLMAPKTDLGKREQRKRSARLLHESRDSLIVKAKNGEIAYSETVLGACLKAGPCEDRAFRALTACLRCPSAVVHLSKLDRLIDCQTRLVGSLSEGSAECIQERRQLADLIEFRKRSDENG